MAQSIRTGSYLTDEVRLYSVRDVRGVGIAGRRVFLLEDSSTWAIDDRGERIYSEHLFTEDEVAKMRVLDANEIQATIPADEPHAQAA